MAVKVDKHLLKKIENNIVLKDTKHTGNYFNDYQNNYAYALNIDLPLYIDIGDISHNYNPNYGLEDYERILIEDCKTLSIDINKVDSEYELDSENSWLIALYITDYYKYFSFRQSTPILIKKNYKSKWSIKNLNEKPRYKDDCGIKINNPINASFSTKDDDGNIIKYKYIGTYKLTK